MTPCAPQSERHFDTAHLYFDAERRPCFFGACRRFPSPGDGSAEALDDNFT
jgi:hypothetical protein